MPLHALRQLLELGRLQRQLWLSDTSGAHTSQSIAMGDTSQSHAQLRLCRRSISPQFSEDTTRRPQPASAVEVFDLSRRSLKDGAPGARAHVIRIRSGFYPLLDKCTTMNRTRAWSTAVHVWFVDDLNFVQEHSNTSLLRQAAAR